VLTAVVTQTGQAFTVQLIRTVPPSTPEEETNTSDAGHTDTQTEGAGTGNETDGEEHVVHAGTKETDEGLVATDEAVHVTAEEAAPGPNPIVPEVKEVLWGAGAFIVFALIMRYVAFPRLKRGMDDRYNGIRTDHEQADSLRATAQAEVAAYQQQVAAVKVEAAAIIDQARQTLEAERTARIEVVNAELAAQRSAALAENQQARLAVQDQIQAAVSDVASTAIRLAVGKTPEPAVVRRVVDEVMSAGVAR
jgi:F-type H+-transporting ATPase subunit b